MSPQDRMIGTWKLVAMEREDLITGAKDNLFGRGSTGYLAYAPDGRMMVMHFLGSRKKPAGLIPTPQEAHSLINSMVSYAGTFTVNADEVTHDIDASWNETWTGLKQRRALVFGGNRISLTTPPQPDPIDGRVSIRRLTWEKVVDTPQAARTQAS